MLAVVCRALGDPSGLTLEERPDPVPGPGQVAIEVAAAGVNYVDALFVAGRYQIRPPLPFVPGSEVAGVVRSVGPGVERVPGERVMASVGLGGFATVVVAGAQATSPVPVELDPGQAATFTQSYSTALFALRHRAALEPGERVLVLGAGGGVGLAAVDVARALGATVVAAASSEDKRAAARRAGAELSVDSSRPSLKEDVRALTGGGVDVVVDPVGGTLAEPALRTLTEGGRYVVIGFASGAIPSLPLNQVLLRNRGVIGVDWGAWAMANGPAQRRLLDELLELVAAGRLRPPLPRVLPLAEAARALEALLARSVIGKLALVPAAAPA